MNPRARERTHWTGGREGWRPAVLEVRSWERRFSPAMNSSDLRREGALGVVSGLIDKDAVWRLG